MWRGTVYLMRALISLTPMVTPISAAMAVSVAATASPQGIPQTGKIAERRKVQRLLTV